MDRRGRGFCSVKVEQIAELATSLSTVELQVDNGAQADRSESGEVAPRKLSSPFLAHEDLRHFELDPRMRSVVRGVIGKEARLFTDQILMKPPRFGSAKPYHQDNAYFQCHPGDEFITAWIALDDVDESNGCLRYIDGSHREPILEHIPVPGEPHNKIPPAELIDLKREVLACAPKGAVVCHHSQTLHTSHRNESDRWRRGFATHWAGLDVTSTDVEIDNAYYNIYPELYAETLALG
jgi:phytanoyl-CoA hydroxylase